MFWISPFDSCVITSLTIDFSKFQFSSVLLGSSFLWCVWPVRLCRGWDIASDWFSLREDGMICLEIAYCIPAWCCMLGVRTPPPRPVSINPLVGTVWFVWREVVWQRDVLDDGFIRKSPEDAPVAAKVMTLCSVNTLNEATPLLSLTTIKVSQSALSSWAFTTFCDAVQSWAK